VTVQRLVHRVRVEPYGIELDIKDGQTIFRVATKLGLDWPTRCGGASACTLCTVDVVDGADRLSKPAEEERFLCAPLARRAEVEPELLRMACAAKVRGPVVVRLRHELPNADDFGSTDDGPSAVAS
jgi:2Fe-2S ferredoxin